MGDLGSGCVLRLEGTPEEDVDPTPARALSQPPRPAAEGTWPQFVESYGRAILEWFRQMGLPRTEIQGFVGQIFGHLAAQYIQVISDPALRFRAWLQYAGHSAWCHLMETQVETANGTPDNSPKLTLLLSVEAHDMFLQALDKECTHQRQRDVLLRLAKAIEPADWRCYAHAILLGRSPTEIATEQGSPEIAVHAAVYRVQTALQTELNHVEQVL